MPSTDFSEMMNAGNTTAKNGNIGDITLVPCSRERFKETIRCLSYGMSGKDLL